MSKHAPWTKEQAEQWADERTVYGRRLSPHQKEIWLDALAKAAEMIEACPTVYVDKDEGHLWNEQGYARPYDTHQAKLVGVRPIEEK